MQDILVGAYQDEGTDSASGAVYIHFMNTDGSIDSTVKIDENTENGPGAANLDSADWYGSSIANLGDLNGDGVQDIAVGARQEEGTDSASGAIFIHFMNTDGSIDSTVKIDENTTNGPGAASLDASDQYGHGVTSIGDLDGNGVVDLLVGARQDEGTDLASGAIYIHYLALDTAAPTTTISSSVGAQTNIPFSITIEFNEDVSGFTLGDITVGNGVASNFVAVDGNTYTADISSTVEAVVTVDVNAGVAQDAATNLNTAATQFSVSYDGILPTVAITSSLSNVTSTSPIPVTIEFSENVIGFAVGDITVANGTKSNFVAVDGNTYTANITPAAEGVVTVNVGAGVAQDAFTNLNAAAAQFSIIYGITDTDGDGSPDVDDTDDDSDGVSDVQEGEDGTNPQDQGSVIHLLDSTFCYEWNGYYGGMLNVAEHENVSLFVRNVQAVLYDSDRVEHGSTDIVILANGEQDVLVHDIDGFEINRLGLVCSTIENGQEGDIVGQQVMYLPNEGGFDFAYPLAFSNGLTGSQYVQFNTYKPSLNPADWADYVLNWAQVTNLEDSERTGSVIVYGQEGEVLSSETLTLAAKERRDIGVHNVGASRVGLVEWRPVNSSAKFLFRLVRYYHQGAEVLSALALSGRYATGDMQSVPLDTRVGLTVLELSNVLSSATNAEVKIYDSEGDEVRDYDLTLPGYGTQHIVVSTIIVASDLDDTTLTATVSGSNASSILASGMHYSLLSNGSINNVFAFDGRLPIGASLRASYNTYLGQGCDAVIVNPGSTDRTASVSQSEFSGLALTAAEDVTIPARSFLSLDVCAEAPVDSYGTIAVQPTTPNTLSSYLIRNGKNEDYRFVLPMR